MADMLADAAVWFAAQQQSHLSQSVTYTRGGNDLSISATRGIAGRQVDPITGGLISWADQDWLIPISVLTIGPPEVGDKIATDAETFEVLPPGAGDCYSVDNTNTIYRIHTKRIEVV
jgi:hypothetical protein